MLLQGLAAGFRPLSPRGGISKRRDHGPGEIGAVGNAASRSGAKDQVRRLPGVLGVGPE
jgi:hypothetical protein